MVILVAAGVIAKATMPAAESSGESKEFQASLRFSPLA